MKLKPANFQALECVLCAQFHQLCLTLCDPVAGRLAVVGFMVMGLVSALSLANHSDSESFLVVHTFPAKKNAREKDSGRWSGTWHLLLTFPELFRLVVAY